MSGGFASPRDGTSAQTAAAANESDFTQLAAKLAAHGNGVFSMQLSSDLALEIVLNEIVEQACLTMRATGAAIILEREGEMVCRASNGETAPALGTRLDTISGLSGECIGSLRSQRCDDAQSDPRADSEACRLLGVRSVMVLPLLRKGRLVGVFEVFSSEAAAFGERDERTAEAFAHRIVRNLERAAEPLPVVMSPPAATEPLQELAGDPGVSPGILQSLQAGLASIDLASGDLAPVGLTSGELTFGDLASGDSGGTILIEQRAEDWRAEAEKLDRQVEPRQGRAMNVLTWALAAAVLVCVILVGQRFIGRKISAHANPGRMRSSAQSLAIDSAASSQISTSNAGSTLENPASASEAKTESPKKAQPAATVLTAPPDGSLQVFEKGKEVFRMAPASGNPVVGGLPAEGIPADQPPSSGKSSGEETGLERASSVESESVGSDRVMQLPPEAVEGNLLRRVEPEYPEEARQQQIQGPVVLDVRINPDGSVQEVSVISGPRLLTSSAMDAVKQWRFRPHLQKGQPVEMQTRITLNFKLPQ